MDRNELVKLINDSAKEAGVSIWTIASANDDPNASLRIDEEDRIWFGNSPTILDVEDVSSVGWWTPDEGEEEDCEPFVRVRFNDGGRFTFYLHSGIGYLSDKYKLKDAEASHDPRFDELMQDCARLFTESGPLLFEPDGGGEDAPMEEGNVMKNIAIAKKLKKRVEVDHGSFEKCGLNLKSFNIRPDIIEGDCDFTAIFEIESLGSEIVKHADFKLNLYDADGDIYATYRKFFSSSCFAGYDALEIEVDLCDVGLQVVKSAKVYFAASRW